MTVATTEPISVQQYTGPGDYSFLYLAYDPATIEVIYTDTSGVTSPLVYNSDYTVTLLEAPNPGGDAVVTWDNDGDYTGTLSILRTLPIEQQVDWVNNNAFDMEILERAFDRVTMMVQQLDLDALVTTDWKGDWMATTLYGSNDIVVAPDSSWYICIEPHTSGADFTTDLAAGVWLLALDVATVQKYLDASEANIAVSENNAANCSNEAYASMLAALASEVAAAISAAEAAASAASAGVFVDTVADLAAITGAEDGDALIVQGHTAIGDGGGGEYHWNDTSTDQENNGTVVKATGVETGRWIRSNSLEVPVEVFGATGGADDTVALIKAMAWGIVSSENILEASGTYNFIATTAAPYMTSGRVPGSNITGGGTINIAGFVGFDLSDVLDIFLHDINIVTTDAYLTDTDEFATNPIFYHDGVAINTIDCNGLSLDVTVTDGTGDQRGGLFLDFRNSLKTTIRGIRTKNTASGIYLSGCSDTSINDCVFENFQTGIYEYTSPSKTRIDNVHGVNTRAQSTIWIQQNHASPVVRNGMDLVLSSDGDDLIITDSTVTFAIERFAYIQSNNVLISDCLAINSEGFKTVGYTAVYRKEHIRINDCHQITTEDFVAEVGWRLLGFAVAYWVDGIIIAGCTQRGYHDTLTNRLGTFCTIGAGIGSVTKLVVRDNISVNGSGALVQVSLNATGGLSAAEYIQLDDAVIENNYVKQSNYREKGSFLEFYTGLAHADALLTYASENIRILSNYVELPPTKANRDDFFYEIMYLDGLIARDNKSNLPFVADLDGGWDTAANNIYTNLLIKEPYLLVDGGGSTLIAKFSLLEVYRGSFFKLTSYDRAYIESYIVTAIQSGALTTSMKELELKNAGSTLGASSYYAYGAALTGIVELTAPTGKYIGKVAGATLTNILSTPPVTLTPSASDFIVRGDIYAGAFTFKAQF